MRMIETLGGERAVRIGRLLSRMVEVPAHIGPSGGVPRAGLLQFLRAPSRNLIRASSHQLGLGPPRNTPTRTMQKL